MEQQQQEQPFPVIFSSYPYFTRYTEKERYICVELFRANRWNITMTLDMIHQIPAYETISQGSLYVWTHKMKLHYIKTCNQPTFPKFFSRYTEMEKHICVELFRANRWDFNLTLDMIHQIPNYKTISRSSLRVWAQERGLCPAPKTFRVHYSEEAKTKCLDICESVNWKWSKAARKIREMWGYRHLRPDTMRRWKKERDNNNNETTNSVVV